MRSRKIKYHSYVLWAFILLSVLGLFLSPGEELLQQVKSNLPWVAIGILISEIILTTGFLLMLSIATPAFIKNLKKDVSSTFSGLVSIKKRVAELNWSEVAKKCNESKTFWVGFWLSVIGAAGDGVVLIIGIGRALPIASWGLMILPFWDLGLTFIIRAAIYRGVKK